MCEQRQAVGIIVERKIGVSRKSDSPDHTQTSLEINSPPSNEDDPFCCKDAAEG